MAATDRTDGTNPGQELAGRVGSAEFVNLRVAPTVEALCATGLLSHAFDERGMPYQARIHPTGASPEDGAVYVGTREPAPLHVVPGRAVDTAVGIIESWGMDSHPALRETGAVLTEGCQETAATDGLGLAGPDVPVGLAHSTLVHGPFSGDREAADRIRERTAERPIDLASLVTLETIGQSGPRAGEAIERILAPVPTPTGPFETAQGMADVLDVLAEVDPGLALALVCGQDAARDRALTTWQETSRDLHAACREVSVDTDDPLIVVEMETTAPGVLARLLRDYCVDGEVVLVESDEKLAIASVSIDNGRLAAVLPEHCDGVLLRGSQRVIVSGPDDRASVERAVREVHA